MAVAFDAGSAGTTGAGGGTALSATWSHTVSGSNRLLVVFLGAQTSATDPVTVKYNGTSLTQYGSTISGTGTANNEKIQVWTLVAPSTGTANVVVDYSPGSAAASMASISLIGVDQTTPLGTIISSVSSTSGTSGSVTVASAATGLVISGVSAVANSNPTATGTSQTRDGSATSGATTPRYTAGSHQPGASSVTPSWSWDVSNGWAIVGLNVYAVGTAPVASTPRPYVTLRSPVVSRSSVI